MLASAASIVRLQRARRRARNGGPVVAQASVPVFTVAPEQKNVAVSHFSVKLPAAHTSTEHPYQAGRRPHFAQTTILP